MLKTTNTAKRHLLNKIVAVFAVILCVIMISGCSNGSTDSANESDNSQSQVTTLDELNGKPVGMLTGASFDREVQERLPESEVKYYQSYADAKIAVKQGIISAYVSELPVAQYQIAIDGTMYYIDESFKNEEYGFVLGKDNTELTEEINGALAELKADGVMDELEEKWMNLNGDELTIQRDPNADTSKGTLNVITAADIQPFSFIKDGEIVGYDIELATRVAEKLGYDITFTNSDFSGVLAAVSTGKYDMAVGGLSITEERKEMLSFSDPVCKSGTVAVLYNSEATTQDTGFLTKIKDSFTRTFITESRWKLIIDGLGITIELAVSSLIIGCILGFLFSFLLRSKNRVVKGLASALSTLLDSMPIVITLMIFYYIIFNKTQLPATIIGILAFSLDFANVVAGLLNTGISAIDKGQLEAAESMGYTRWQTFRKITFPQAASQMIGQFNGAVIGLIKGTAVVGYIAVQDLTKAGDIVRSRTYEAFFPLIAIAIIYFVIAHLIVAIIKRFEIKLDFKRRPRKVKGVDTND
jgi:polar amino acid transport system substrate-binding protein